ncbi:MAG TPA: DUF2950 domain-containing protein [Terriglobales bacterium]
MHFRASFPLPRRHSSAFVTITVFLCLAAATELCPQTPQPQSGTFTFQQRMFKSPRAAADALIRAAEAHDVPALVDIFGPDGKKFVSSADPVQDKNIEAKFAAKAHEKNSVAVHQQPTPRAILLVGKNDWPFPIPIIRKDGKWFFDTAAGRDEILYRRIGTNELDAIQVCRGFVEAQREYASQVHDNSGINQYAQKIISTPGKQDGLFWKNSDGSLGGPISEAVARAIAEGYTANGQSPYHGYHFKVLKGQGPAAPLGQLDYVINGVMIGGFALAAAPAQYRVTGVKTFIVGYDGIVYEQDLGPNSLKVFEKIDRYNPDKGWTRTNDQWPQDVTSTLP